MSKMRECGVIGRWAATACAAMLAAGSAAGELPADAIKKMASDEFAVRRLGYEQAKEWAQKNLKNAPEMLYKEWKRSPDPEVKTRCYTLMKETLLQRKYGRGRGFVGVRMEEVAIPGKKGAAALVGVRVMQVLPDTPGKKAGLVAGDVVTGVDAVDFSKRPGRRLPDHATNEFSRYIQSKHPGDTITLHIVRAGKKIQKKVTLMKRPAEADRFGDPLGRRAEARREARERYFNDWLKKMGGE